MQAEEAVLPAPTGTGTVAPDPARERQLLELLLDATTDGVMDWDLTRGEIRYTARWKLLLGYESDELVDSPTLWSDLTHPEDLPRVQELLRDHLENFWPFTHTWRMRRASGDWCWVLCRAVTATDSQARPTRLVGVFSDITDRIRAEERHRALASAIPDLMLRVRIDGTVVDVKVPDGEAPPPGLSWPTIGQLLSDWGPAKDWHERVRAGIADSGSGTATKGMEVTLAGTAGRRYADLRVVPSGEDEAVCIVRDVTDQRQLQAQVMQTGKLESIGQLAAGIAHEINTPIQYVGDSLTFLQEACGAFTRMCGSYQQTLAAADGRPLSVDETEALAQLREDLDLTFITEHVPKALENALEGVGRVARIVSAMKAFSHPAQVDKVDSNLNREIETTITISTSVWKQVAEVHRVLDPELPAVPCHPGEINQVVLNLIVNAAHAISDASATRPGMGSITITTSSGGGYAEIRVTDSGTGIPEKVRDKIFDPFFTTKEVGRGTGQGLAMARSTIVDKHGGTIDFETQMGKGTTFIVRLPLAPATRKG